MRLVSSCFLRRITPEIHDRNAVADFPEMRGRAVEFDQTFLRFAVNHVSLKALAIAQVPNENLLVFAHLNQLSQIGRNSEAAFVSQARSRPSATTNFRFQ